MPAIELHEILYDHHLEDREQDAVFGVDVGFS